MTTLSQGQQFYQRRVSCLETQDIDELVNQYHEDAYVIGLDFVAHGHEAIRNRLSHFLESVGGLSLKSTDSFSETENAVFFAATIQTRDAEIKVSDGFVLRDGKATHQFTSRKRRENCGRLGFGRFVGINAPTGRNSGVILII